MSQLALAVVVVLGSLSQNLQSEQTGSADEVNQFGIELYKSAHYEDALSTFNRALSLYQLSGNLKDEATALSEIAMSYSGLGQTQRALDYLDKALAKWRQLGDRDDEASTLGREATSTGPGDSRRRRSGITSRRFLSSCSRVTGREEPRC